MRWRIRRIQADCQCGHRCLSGAGLWPARDLAESARSGARAFAVEKCAAPERISGCAGLPSVRPMTGARTGSRVGADRATRVLARIRRDAAKRRARIADGYNERAVPSLPLFAVALFASLLVAGCSLVGKPEPACRPLEVAEFPLLGGIRGTWMDDERFVLADLHQSRLLVYNTSRGLVRIVNGWESVDPELNFVSPMDIQPWRGGFVLVDLSAREDFLLELDSELQPVRVLWKSDVVQVDGVWRGEEIDGLDEVATLGDRLYLRAGRLSDSRVTLQPLYAEFGPDRRSDQAAGAGHVVGASERGDVLAHSHTPTRSDARQRSLRVCSALW